MWEYGRNLCNYMVKVKDSILNQQLFYPFVFIYAKINKDSSVHTKGKNNYILQPCVYYVFVEYKESLKRFSHTLKVSESKITRSMDKFWKAVEKVTELPENLSNDELLALYGLYKQVTEGNNENREPWRIQIRQYAKWEAWNDNNGMSREEAIERYIRLVDFLISRYG